MLFLFGYDQYVDTHDKQPKTGYEAYRHHPMIAPIRINEITL